MVMAMALTAGFFASCSDEGCWEAYDTTSEPTYSFELKSTDYVLAATDTIKEVVVRVFRNTTEGEFVLPVDVVINNRAMAVDTAVVFADGQDYANFVIAVDYDNLPVGRKNTAKIALAEPYLSENASISGHSETTVSILIEYSWQSIGEALYTEGLVSTFFGVQNLTYEVAAEQAVENPSIIRLVDPYGAAYPYNAPGDYDVSKKHYMQFNCEDPDGVYMDGHHASGMDWGYGEFTFGCLAYYYMDKGDSVKAAGYMGTLDENLCITFPAKAMLIGMAEYNGGGLYTSNVAGAFKVDLSTTTIAE